MNNETPKPCKVCKFQCYIVLILIGLSTAFGCKALVDMTKRDLEHRVEAIVKAEIIELEERLLVLLWQKLIENHSSELILIFSGLLGLKGSQLYGRWEERKKNGKSKDDRPRTT